MLEMLIIFLVDLLDEPFASVVAGLGSAQVVLQKAIKRRTD
jgi:hypothetical protein